MKRTKKKVEPVIRFFRRTDQLRNHFAGYRLEPDGTVFVYSNIHRQEYRSAHGEKSLAEAITGGRVEEVLLEAAIWEGGHE